MQQRLVNNRSLQVMLIYPICVAFDIDGHGEMIVVGVKWYF